jgi:hypothetical protein
VGDGVKRRPRRIIHSVLDQKGIQGEAGEVNSTKAYVTNDVTSRRIPNGCYTSLPNSYKMVGEVHRFYYRFVSNISPSADIAVCERRVVSTLSGGGVRSKL